MTIPFLSPRQTISLFLLPSAISIGVVFFWQQFGFLSAHLVSEIAGIVLAGTAFIVGALLQGFLRTQALSTLAIAFGWSAILSLLHALSYPGMGLLPIDEQSVSAALGLSARWVEAMAFMLAGLHHRRVLPPWAIHISFAVITLTLAISAFDDWTRMLYSDVLTPSSLQLIIEVTIVAILLRELLIIWHRRAGLSDELRIGLTLALLFFIGAELVVLLFRDPFGAPQLIAQSLNLFVYWLVYQIIVKTSLIEPYDRLEHVSKVYDAVVDPTLLVDHDGVIKKANVAAGRALGVSPALLAGKSSHVLFHNTEATPDDCVVCRAIKNRGTLDRHEITRKHGTSLVQVSVNRVDESNGGDLYVEVLHDLSEVARLRQDLASIDGVAAQQAAALEALGLLFKVTPSTEKQSALDLEHWVQLLPRSFRAPSLIKIHLRHASMELGTPPAANTEMLNAAIGAPDSADELTVYYLEPPDPAAPSFTALERALFEMLSAALRDKLAP